MSKPHDILVPIKLEAVDPAYENQPGFEHRILLCPRCQNNNLHQGMVTTFNRREDAQRVQRTEVTPHPVAIKSELVPNGDENPSARRHALTIDFYCEHCGEYSGEDLVLCIEQHKGCTYMYWRMRW